MVFKLLQSFPVRWGWFSAENSVHPLLFVVGLVSGLRVLHRQIQICWTYILPHSEPITINAQIDEGNEKEEGMHVKKESVSFQGIGEVRVV